MIAILLHGYDVVHACKKSKDAKFRLCLGLYNVCYLGQLELWKSSMPSTPLEKLHSNRRYKKSLLDACFILWLHDTMYIHIHKYHITSLALQLQYILIVVSILIAHFVFWVLMHETLLMDSCQKLETDIYFTQNKHFR